VKRILALLTILVLLLLHGAPAFAKPTPSHTSRFRDLPNNHWAFQAVDVIVGRNVLKGYPDGTFKPGATVSRAEFAKPQEPLTRAEAASLLARLSQVTVLVTPSAAMEVLPDIELKPEERALLS
jgi:hypothetical protein